MHAHTDKLNDSTYSIKVGKTIPPNSVNLAYVDSKDLTPEYNIEIADYAEHKKQNTVEMIAEPSPDFILKSVVDGNSYVDTRNIEVTDEFSVKFAPSDKAMPLYYKAHLSRPFSLNNGGIILNPGYTDSLASVLKSSTENQISDTDNVFLYLGDKIKITKTSASAADAPVNPNSYKIILTRSTNNTASVDIYTNFRNTTSETYKVTYQSTAGIVTEVLNAYTFFSQDDDLISQLVSSSKQGTVWSTDLNKEVFTVREQDDKYQVYAPTHLLIANKDTRPSQKFRYKIEANLDVRYGIDKPCTINIGMVYLNAVPTGGQYNAEDVTDVIPKLRRHAYMPDYISFINPHPVYGSVNSGNYNEEMDNPNYWLVNLDSPEEFINDYDIIIITGYGQYDITPYNYVLRRFLEQGGSLWIDNGGSGVTAFDPANDTTTNIEDHFIIDISFSQTVNNNTTKVISKPTHKLFNRIWNITDVSTTGYNNIGPRIDFGSYEVQTDWTNLISYTNGNPCVAQKNLYGKGTVTISTCGLLRAAHKGEEGDIKLLVNLILSMKENVWVYTPWLHDSVLNRTNVFANEYRNSTEGFYEDSYSLTDNTVKVAKKVLQTSVESALKKYMTLDYDIMSGSYNMSIEQVGTITLGDGSTQSGYIQTSNVSKGPLQALNSQVYVYTTQSSGANSFNITSEGMKNGYFKIYHENLTVQYTINVFYYEWDGQVYFKDIKNYETRTITINKSNGILNLGLIENLLPAIPSDVSDRSRVHFEVLIAAVDQTTQKYVYSDLPVNVQIYNPKTGSYIYDVNGNAVLSYSELYENDNNRSIKLYMWTDYQTIAVNTRKFGVKVVNDADIFAELPATDDEVNPWYVQVHNGTYKTNFDDTRDLVEEGGLHPDFVYEVPEYYEQVFNPGAPYVKVYDEKATYMDYHRVSLANKGIFVDRGNVVGEAPQLVASNTYRLNHSPITLISIYDDFGAITTASIDYEYGIIKPTQAINGTLKADYTWNNLTAVKRIYGKQMLQKEELERLDNNSFRAKHNPIMKYPAPKVYMRVSGKDQLLQSIGVYTIDYENGIVNLKSPSPNKIFMTYNYQNDIDLTITDYDVINGIITFQETIDFTDEIYVTYHHEQNYYEYKGYIDKDGIFNYLDINPSEGHTFTYNKKSIPSSTLINKPIYIYMVPRKISNFIYYTRIPSNIITVQNGKPVVNIVDKTSSWDSVISPINHIPDQLSYIPYDYIKSLRMLTGDISSNPDNTLNDAINSENKNAPYVDKTMGLVPTVVYNTDSKTYPNQKIIGGYLINNAVIRHAFSKEEFEDIQKNTAGVKLLAVIQIKETKFDINLIDARQPGGGLKSSIPMDTIIKKNGAENLSYWDISTWDGMAYQKNGTVVIKLPKEVLIDNGGNFTRNQVEEYIEQFIALGVFYIVEYI